MDDAESFALQAVEKVADSEGYVDLRIHRFDPSLVDILRTLERKDSELLSFPSNYRLQFFPKGRSLARQLRGQSESRWAGSPFANPTPPEKPPVFLSPFEKAIYPWFATLSHKWQKPPDEMSDAEEKALARLLEGGFVEAKVEVTSTPAHGGPTLRAVWRVTGPFASKFEEAIRNHFSARGQAGADVRLVKRTTALRLTSEGEQAKGDFAGQHEFKKPGGTGTGMPKELFDLISGGSEGKSGSRGTVSVVFESESGNLHAVTAPTSPPPSSSMSPMTVLFLSSDPQDADRLRLDAEVREIGDRLRRVREKYRFAIRMAVRPADITDAIHDEHPQIVHFSGHGTSAGGLCFENHEGDAVLVEPDALASLFKLLVGQVQAAIFNACFSEAQARAVATHIPYVIGMRQDIGDEAAIVFSTGFYKALAAGKSIPDSFEFGLVELRLLGIPEHETPTGRVYVYHENHFSLQELANLEALFSSKNAAVQFRGHAYLVLHWEKGPPAGRKGA